MKKYLPDLLVIVSFILISFAYFFPADVEGRILFQHDTAAGVGASHEVNQYYEQTGEHSRWTNALFGGMPTYQIAPSYDSTKPLAWLQEVYRLFLPSYVCLTFIMMLGFFILLRAFGIPAWLAGLGGVLWGFSSYFFILISAGHIWKFITLAYIPPTLAGIVLAYRGRLLAGGIVTAVFIALQVTSNHVQMSYYFLLVILCFVLAYFEEAWRQKQLARFFKASAVLVVAALIGVATNLSNLYHTYTYSKETMRGKSELVQTGDAAQETSSGLDRDYITQWSYGIGETLTLLVPNFKGGASVPLAASEVAMQKANPMYGSIYNGLTQYFGDQPMTSGPVYVGAFVVFLFILGCIVVRGPLKWALIGATALSILLSWGKNFMPLTDFFIDYVPMYNKFRAVSSILVVAEFTIPLLALFALVEVLRRPQVLVEKLQTKTTRTGVIVLGACCGLILYLATRNGFAVSDIFPALLACAFTGFYFWLAYLVMTRLRGGVLGFALWQTAGVALLIMVMPDAFTGYIPAYEGNMLRQVIPADQLSPVLSNLEDVRRTLVTSDARRSLFVILIGAALLGLYAAGKLRRSLAVVGVAVLCLVDLWGVNKRYLNDKQFVAPSAQTETFKKTATDELILQDPALDYRVLNFAGSTFNENNTSYWHKSVGGYHAAKLRRYQELIDRYIQPEMTALAGDISRTGGEVDSLDASKFRVLNMLNTRYFIFLAGQNGQTVPLRNPYTYGNAWFVNRVQYVDNANQELDALGKIEPTETAVVDARFKDALRGATDVHKDSLSTIRLTDYRPNRVVYEADNAKDGVAVFSEVYYPDGWQVTIDGQPVDLGRADYILRTLYVPAGKHTIEMRFDPQSLHVTEAIAYTALALLVLGAVGAVLLERRRGRTPQSQTE